MTAEALLAELAAPNCFPHPPAGLPIDVQIVQTHLSVVCLAGDLVYKLKKAVTLPFVDFAPLAARRQACRDEVRLNRRLCPDTYLGTASLRRRGDGALQFAALGDDDGPDDLDVAVVMRRLPADRMLDEMLRHHAVTALQVEQLAQHVAAFHANAAHDAAIAAIGDPHRLATFAAANFTELQAMPKHGLPVSLLAALANASRADFARILPTLEQRAARGLVVDGHGDLHARNVCMTSPPMIYDCIEFEPAFRIGDVATEVAFLAMDLRYRGAPELAQVFVAAYAEARADRELAALLPTLCSYRAMVRAKVAALSANESEVAASDRAAARASAAHHLMLAAAYTIENRGACWIVVCGPPASGKSQLCATLHAATNWPSLNTDRVRKELAQLPPTATARAEHYTPEFSQRTYTELLVRAATLTRAGAPVVLLDGNFPSARHRADAATAARAAGSRVQFVHVHIDVATARARAAARQATASVSDADADVAAALHARFEAPGPDDGHDVLQLDGRQPSEELGAATLTALLRERPRDQSGKR